MVEGRDALDNARDGADLSGGAACVVEKGDQLLRGAALEPLSHIVRYRESRALQLVRDITPVEESLVLGKSKDTRGELDAGLPDGDLLETGEFYACPLC
jgi:hypothetical protein